MATNSLKSTRFTALTVAPHEKASQVFNPANPAIWKLIDVQSVTLPGASNCAAATVTEIAIALTGALTTDLFVVQPAASMIAGLGISFAYCLVAGTLRIRFINPTAGIIDAAGTYNFLLFRR